MNKNSTLMSSAFSFSSQARFYFAGRYFYAYYFGEEYPKNLARPAACPQL